MKPQLLIEEPNHDGGGLNETSQKKIQQNHQLEIEHISKTSSEGTTSRLTNQEKLSLLLILSLYFLKVLPIGFYSHSLPILLAEKKSDYKDLALLSLSRWLVLLKPILAPIIDTKFSQRIGRRKTYILPTQFLISIILIIHSFYIVGQIERKETEILSLISFLVTILITIQEIAIVGWGVSLLRKEFASYVTTMSNTGNYVGSLTSANFFILATSDKFKQWLSDSSLGIDMKITSQDFLLFYGIITFIATLSIFLFQRNDHQPSSKQSARQTMQLMKGFYSNPNLKLLSMFLLIWQFGFSMVESVWMYQMLERGFPKEIIVLFSTCSIPIKVLMNFVIGVICKKHTEMSIFLLGFFMRIILNLCLGFLVERFDETANIRETTLLLLGTQFFFIMQSSCIKIGLGSFQTRIADQKIGGTYMSTIHAISTSGRRLSSSGAIFLSEFSSFIFLACIGGVYSISLISSLGLKLFHLQKRTHEEFLLELEKKEENQENDEKNIASVPNLMSLNLELGI